MKPQKSLFDTIAPVYNVFFNYQVRSFRTILSRAGTYLIVPKNARVLDIGCGTGALAFCLNEMGYRVTGVDASPKMVEMAQKNNKAAKINFLVADVLKGLPYKDKSFDLIMSSYVAHGLQRESRLVFFTEAKRLAATQLIFQDYNKKRKALSDLVEWVERGDYFYFIQHAEDEMKGIFQTVDVRSFAAQIAWYICTP